MPILNKMKPSFVLRVIYTLIMIVCQISAQGSECYGTLPEFIEVINDESSPIYAYVGDQEIDSSTTANWEIDDIKARTLIIGD